MTETHRHSLIEDAQGLAFGFHLGWSGNHRLAVETLPDGRASAALGALFVAIDAGVMVAYALAGRQAVRWLSGDGLRWLNRGCAVGMGLLALLLASVRRQAA